MRRKKASSDTVKATNRGNSKKQVKGSNTDNQLQFPWYNEPIQESTPKVPIKPAQTRVSHDPAQLDNADKRMQKITKQRDELRKRQSQTELSFTDKVPDPPQKSALLDDSIPNDVADTIIELPESFEGKGNVSNFKYTQIKRSDLAYLYKGLGNGDAFYEIFERRVNSRYGNVIYPNINAFGVWAWTTSDFNKALAYFDEINRRKGNDLCV